MIQILTFNVFILYFAFAISASKYHEMFAFLPRYRARERIDGMRPIVIAENDVHRFGYSPNQYYDFKSTFSPMDFSTLIIRNGPDGFGCFAGSLEQPHRSHFVTKGRALEQTIQKADYMHCYALEFPERDVLVDMVNLEGMRSSIVLNTEQGFGSLPIPRHYLYIDSIAMVEEADSNLMCRVDFADGDPLYMSAQNPELTNVSGAISIGCEFSEENHAT